MPAYKHPCPSCGQFIMHDVVACPYCGRQDPFAPARCPSCRTVLDDPRWIACPRCGANLVTAAPGGSPSPAPGKPVTDTERAGSSEAAPNSAGATTPSGPAVTSATCSGCGAPLPAGARFCTSCGTLAG